jgi:GNAT superfamily N-acetyltransferase
MKRELGIVSLDGRTTAEIVLVDAPDQEHREAILKLLAHKGPVWQRHMEAALDGQTDHLETRWHLAIVNGAPVANAMLVERHGVGILGHVFTCPEYRQRGLSRAVLTAMLQEFESRGGRALVLGTGYESVAYRLYASLGFEPIRRGFMGRYLAGRATFEAEWFAPGPAAVHEARWEHWPLLAMLASYPARTVAADAPWGPGGDMRSAAWGVRDIANLEWPYCNFMAGDRVAGTGATVAQTDRGVVVACATVTPFQVGNTGDTWPGVWLADAFAHPLHGFKLGDVLTGLEFPPGLVVALVPLHDDVRAAAFAQAGFRQEGRLPAALDAMVGLTDGGVGRGDIGVLCRHGRGRAAG